MSTDLGLLHQNKVQFGSDQDWKFRLQGKHANFFSNETQQTGYENGQQVVRSPKLASIAGKNGWTTTKDLSPLRRVASTTANSGASLPVASLRRLLGSFWP